MINWCSSYGLYFEDQLVQRLAGPNHFRMTQISVLLGQPMHLFTKIFKRFRRFGQWLPMGNFLDPKYDLSVLKREIGSSGIISDFDITSPTRGNLSLTLIHPPRFIRSTSSCKR
jgi:hypothetical protein